MNDAFTEIAAELADQSVAILVELEPDRIDTRAGTQLIQASHRREPVHSVEAGQNGCWLWFDRSFPIFLAGASAAPVQGARLAYALNCGVALELVFTTASTSTSVIVDAIRDRPRQADDCYRID